MTHSKFKKITVIFLPVLVLGALMCLVLSYLALTKLLQDFSKSILIIVPAFSSYVLFLATYHLAYKWDIIEISGKKMFIKKCFGIGRKIIIDLTQVTAFTSSERVRFGGETLIIKSDGRKLVELSDFSYSNFQELKSAIKLQTPITMLAEKTFLKV